MLISLCYIFFKCINFPSLLFFFNSAFEYDYQLGFGNHFDVVDQLSDGSIIEIYRMIFRALRVPSTSSNLDSSAPVSTCRFFFCNDLFDFSNLF